MRPTFVSTRSRPAWLIPRLALVGLLFLTSGFSSCAETTGPLLLPVHITPTEVLLRASVGGAEEAIALARVDNGDSNDQYRVSIEYEKDPGVAWLAVDVDGRNLTLRAKSLGLEPRVYRATVSVEGDKSGATASLRVEFTVTEPPRAR